MVRKILAILTITAAAGSLPAGVASAQDAAKGEAVFKQCMTCHRADKNMVGPALAGGSATASVSFPAFGSSQHSDVRTLPSYNRTAAR